MIRKAKGRLRWQVAKEKNIQQDILKTIRGKTLIRKPMASLNSGRTKVMAGK